MNLAETLFENGSSNESETPITSPSSPNPPIPPNERAKSVLTWDGLCFLPKETENVDSSDLTFSVLTNCSLVESRLALFNILYDDSEQRIERMMHEIVNAIMRKNTWMYKIPDGMTQNEISEGILRAWFSVMSHGSDIIFTMPENGSCLFWVPVFVPSVGIPNVRGINIPNIMPTVRI